MNNEKPPLSDASTRLSAWIAPYKDEQGNYHEASVAWVVTNQEVKKVLMINQKLK